jgi:hypothetical protein
MLVLKLFFSRVLVFVLICVCGLFYSARAHAKKHAEGGFDKAEMQAVSKLLKRYGVVALSETKPNGMPRAMTLAVRVDAPRQVVFDIFKDPLKFNFLSSLFEEAKVLDNHAESKAYSWASRHKLFSVVGTNTITLFPPRRIDVSVVKSSLGSGNVTFRLYEDGPNRTIFVLSGIIDVQSSEWLIRFLIGNSPAMRQAMNVAIGLVVIKGAKAMAESIHKKKPLAKHRTRGKRTGPLKPISKGDLALLKPILDRGSVILSASLKGGRLRQATVLERVAAPSAKFVGAVATPEFYPKMIKAMSDIVVHERGAEATEFTWTLGLSVFGLTTRSRLTFQADGVNWEGIEGDLKGALWRWQVIPETEKSCVVAYHSWADILKSTYILEKSMRREPYLEHGFMVGSNMVMLRAVKRTVESK